jgi:RHS repeat-associated protein
VQPPQGEVFELHQAFDPQQRLRARTVTNQNANPLLGFGELRLDEVGNISSLERVVDGERSQHVFAYNASQQLRCASYLGSSGTHCDLRRNAAQYLYDAFGNVILRSAWQVNGVEVDAATVDTNPDNPYQYAEWEYDEAGRAVRKGHYCPHYSTHGERDRVTDCATSGLISASFYDAKNHRVRSVGEEYDHITIRKDGDVVTQISLDGEQQEQETTDYVYSPFGLGIEVQKVLADSEVAWVFWVADQVGSPIGRWMPGELQESLYSPFGTQLQVARHDGPVGFTGHEDEPDKWQVYAKARMLDTWSMKFDRPDPARDLIIYEPYNFNLYSYARNNPLRYSDPTGFTGRDELDATMDKCGLQLAVGCTEKGLSQRQADQINLENQLNENDLFAAMIGASELQAEIEVSGDNRNNGGESEVNG